MPSHSVKQAKVMSAISHGWHPSEGSVAKIPVKVAKEFHAADAGHKYGKGHDKVKRALNTAKKYAKKAEGGEVDDEQKQQAISIKPVDPFENYPQGAAFGVGSPAEMSQQQAGFSPRAQEPQPPENVLYRTASPLVNITDQDIERGIDVANSSGVGAMSGATKAKAGLMSFESTLQAAANYGMTATPGAGEKYLAKALKAEYPKDIATQAVEAGYTKDEIANLKSYLSPGAQKAFDKHYGKIAPKKEPSFKPPPWNESAIQATKPVAPEHPDYIKQQVTSQGADYDKILANMEKQLSSPETTYQPIKPKPFGISSDKFALNAAHQAPDTPWADYDALHNHWAQQPINLTDAQKGAVGYWGSQDGYKDINGTLRGQPESVKSYAAIQDLNSAMLQNPLKEDTSVWRGLYGPQAEELRKLKEGDVFFNKGYTATTIDPRQSTHYGAKDTLKYKKDVDNILLNYHLPAGTPSLYVSHPDAGNYIQSERELLLPHGGKYSIIGTEKIKSPVWHYLGNLVDAEPREFTVYHVAPTQEGKATQLDIGKSDPEPWQVKANKALEESVYKVKGKDTDIEDYYAHMEKQQAGPEWTPPPSLGIDDYFKDAIDKHVNFVDWKDYKPLSADPSPESVKKYRENIVRAGGNPDVTLLKGGHHEGYPKQTPSKDIATSSTKALFLGDKKASSSQYGSSITPYVAVPRQKVAVIDFKDLLGSIGSLSHNGTAHAYDPAFVEMIQHIREKYNPEMLVAHNVTDWAEGGSKPNTQYMVYKTNILRAPHAAFDPNKWHLRLPLAAIPGLPAGAAIYSYGDKKESEGMAKGGRVEAEKALPPDHQLGMKVPKGGSMCKNCKFLASPTTCGNKGWIEWHGNEKLPEPSDEYCCDNYGIAEPEHKAGGGEVKKKHADPEDREFQDFSGGGLIESSVPGRTDKHPLKVSAGSYVLPSDFVSALGQNNTAAGAEVVKKMFKSAPYGLEPMTSKASKFSFPSYPSPARSVGKADGGGTDHEHVSIIAAGGEIVLTPDEVKQVGNGDIRKGHDILDRLVLIARKDHIKKLKSLKAPKK
jgi:hypothetical protein